MFVLARARRNLDWHMEASVVDGHLRDFLATVDVHVEGEGGGTKSVVDMGMEAIEIVPFEDGKKRGRDADKLHQGFALVRFEQASILFHKRARALSLAHARACSAAPRPPE